jgi:exonuclease VII large subunit
MATATQNYAPTVKAKAVAPDKWQKMQAELNAYRGNAAQAATQAPQTVDNGWGNTQARVDPYNQAQVNQAASDQFKQILGQIQPALQQQQQQQQTALYTASDRAQFNQTQRTAQQQQGALQQTAANSDAAANAQIKLSQSTAGQNDRELERYKIAKMTNAQYQSAEAQANAQRDSAASMAEAQKYTAQAAKEGGIYQALYSAVGNIASGFGNGGRYW